MKRLASLLSIYVIMGYMMELMHEEVSRDFFRKLNLPALLFYSRCPLFNLIGNTQRFILYSLYHMLLYLLAFTALLVMTLFLLSQLAYTQRTLSQRFHMIQKNATSMRPPLDLYHCMMTE